MAITTYAELQSAVAGWLVRGDLTARIPDFIALAEARLNRVLRTRLNEVDAPLATAPGARRIALPAGLTQPLRLWLERPEGRQELPFTPIELLAVSNRRGSPRGWSLDGAFLVLDRPADAVMALTLRMLRAYRLTDAAPSNDLLADSPDIYLFATLCEAAPFLRDADLAGACEARLARALADLTGRDAQGRAAGRLSTEIAGLMLERSC